MVWDTNSASQAKSGTRDVFFLFSFSLCSASWSTPHGLMNWHANLSTVSRGSCVVCHQFYQEKGNCFFFSFRDVMGFFLFADFMGRADLERASAATCATCGKFCNVTSTSKLQLGLKLAATQASAATRFQSRRNFSWQLFCCKKKKWRNLSEKIAKVCLGLLQGQNAGRKISFLFCVCGPWGVKKLRNLPSLAWWMFRSSISTARRVWFSVHGLNTFFCQEVLALNSHKWCGEKTWWNCGVKLGQWKHDFHKIETKHEEDNVNIYMWFLAFNKFSIQIREYKLWQRPVRQ